MNILLVYPFFPDSYWSFRHALFLENRRSAFPPLGLLTIAAMMPPAWQRRLVDLNIESLQQSDIEWADMVFISAMRIQGDSMTEIINLCKRMGKRVVVGGPYVSSTPEDAPGADHIFVGEAETTFPEFVRDVAAGKARRIYEAKDRPDMTISPVPDFSLVKMDMYLAMPIQYSRGCPFRCEFCDIIELYGRVPRTKTNEQMIAELEALYNTGRRGVVFIVDDNFIGNKRNVRTLLPHLIAWSEKHNYPFSFTTEASINLADDDELLADMQKAGFHRVFVGIETPDEGSLKEAQKGQNTKRNMLDGVRKIQSYGMEVMGGFIVGFDNDPDDIFDKQIDFIRDSAIPVAMVGLLNAAPHTQLWRRLGREGRLLDGFHGNNVEAALNFVPKMDPDRLIEGYRRVLRTVYSSREYYQRVLDTLERMGDEKDGVPQQIGGGLLQGLVTLGKTVITLGFRDRDRGEFWRFIGRVLRERRERFPHAIVFAALGYHFRRLTQEILDQPPVSVPARRREVKKVEVPQIEVPQPA